MSLYLVTGAAGFIGSGLVRGLLERGHSVRGLDNFSTGKRENLSEILGSVDFREADLLDPKALAAACRGVDFILHQAAISSVPKSVADPASSHHVNADGTLALLLAAREARVRRVVYASSCSVYGDSPTLPKHEAMPADPISPYAVAKLAGELYAVSFFRMYGLETVSLRYFNVFGPRQDANAQYSGVLARFISLMLQGKAPTIFGDGEQSRDFVYIDNVVQANLLACEAHSTQVAGRIFNVASGDRRHLNDTFSLLQRITGYSGPARYEAERSGDVKHSLADVSLAKKHLGYKTLVGFEEGLRRTVEWYGRQPSNQGRIEIATMTSSPPWAL